MLWMQYISLKEKVTSHHHAMHEFIVCCKGHFTVTTDHHQYLIEPGGSIFIPSDTRHQIDCEAERNRVLLACIDNSTLGLMRTPSNRVYLDTLAKQTSHAFFSHKEQQDVIHCISEIRELGEHKTLINQSLQESCLMKLLLLHSKRQESPLFTESKNEKIEAIGEWINENYLSEISIDELCLRFALSRSQLTRKFRQQFGYSLMEYVLTLRFESAALQLATNSKGVSEIALESGFNNLSHFHRQFKKRFGMTPLAFKNMVS